MWLIVGIKCRDYDAQWVNTLLLQVGLQPTTSVSNVTTLTYNLALDVFWMLDDHSMVKLITVFFEHFARYLLCPLAAPLFIRNHQDYSLWIVITIYDRLDGWFNHRLAFVVHGHHCYMQNLGRFNNKSLRANTSNIRFMP